MDIPELGVRERQILHAIVHTYITTAEPVGSRTIVKRFDLDLSPATVRNVMSDLEEAGLLEQPHTSSGRTPTDKGYRYYIDYLMKVQELTLAERNRIEAELNAKLDSLDDMLRQTSQLLALISHQTGIVEAPDAGHTHLRRIELIEVDGARLAVLVADNHGQVRTLLTSSPVPLKAGDLPRLNRFLNETLHGARVDQLAAVMRERLGEFVDEQRWLAETSMRILDLAPVQRTAQLFLEGATQLFEQPEFRDVSKAREVFQLLEERERLSEILRASMSEKPPARWTVLLGSEVAEKGLADISVVASPYKVGDNTVGMIGVLGPRRMPYSRLTSVVDYTAGLLSRLMTKLAG